MTGLFIRPYTESDYPRILSWWKASGEDAPFEDQIPFESSWVVEHEGAPVLCCSLILTNVARFAWINNLIASPSADRQVRKEAMKLGLEYVRDFAKSLGYRNLFCMTHRDKLSLYYESFGFQKSPLTQHCFLKEI